MSADFSPLKSFLRIRLFHRGLCRIQHFQQLTATLAPSNTNNLLQTIIVGRNINVNPPNDEGRTDIICHHASFVHTRISRTDPLLALICEPYFASITCATCDSTGRRSVLS
jgi:hypothetical protein